MFGNDIDNLDVTVRGGTRDHIGSRLNLVGNNRIRGSMQTRNPVDFNHIRAGTAYIGAHGIEEVCKVNDMRFLCGVFNHGQPRRFDRREHAVNGRAYRHQHPDKCCCRKGAEPLH